MKCRMKTQGEVQQAARLALGDGEASDEACVGGDISMLFFGAGSLIGLVGLLVGSEVGSEVGLLVGSEVGSEVGLRVGVWVGLGVDELVAAFVVGGARARS